MSRRILVVDDDRAMVRTLCDIFRLRGWDARGAYSGEEALALQDELRCPVVLMDVKMCGIDGVAAGLAMKAAAPELRVILMTAMDSGEGRPASEPDHGLRILPKPVDIAGLLALLD